MENKLKNFLISKVESQDEKAQMSQNGIFVILPNQPKGGKTSLVTFSVFSDWRTRKDNSIEYHTVALKDINPNKLYNYVAELIKSGKTKFKL